ncbi:DUF3592 domain-containing protein [Parahaliea maris]|uniref:DUF3592 domain-containing protein n=2 Tax=Parahaliea maris TaxID=2716870 RepID=A0A5C9A209_9GAMM|nr:DUF3592 domain-containing protein [Parahaliea maris]
MSGQTPTRFSLFRRNNGWFGVLVSAVGLLLFLASFMAALLVEGSQEGAVDTQATVSRLMELEHRTGIKKRDKSWAVYVNYTVEGQSYSGSESVSRTFFDQLMEGDTLPISYLPESPETIWIEHYSSKEWFSWLRYGGLAILALGAYLIRGVWSYAGGAIRMLQSGERVAARVTGVKDVSGSREKAYRLLWEDGEGATGQTLNLSEARKARYPVGSEIEIMRDPAKKMRPIWVGDVTS